MSLHFNVSQLLKADVGQTRSYEFSSESPIDLDGDVAEQVEGNVKFTLTNFGILAQGRANGVLHLTCARCLEPFSTPAHVSFDEEYQPTIDITTGTPSATPRTEHSFGISDNHTIDLSEAIRQHFVLAIDLIPICRADCQGLCPGCGRNLNVQTCTCPPATDENPFSVLQQLLVESEVPKNA